MIATLPSLEPDTSARERFGESLPLASAYVRILADDGVTRGLIGPREVPRLWSRHLVNCAMVADLIPVDQLVVDIGSGAGLPGIAIAILRKDLDLVLVEPMQRRTRFLEATIVALGLERRVRVIRGRADDAHVVERVAPVSWVVARAVAPLDRLVRWTMPLLTADGCLLAMKGESAGAELARHPYAGAEIVELSNSEQRTWVVRVRKGS